MNNSVNVQSPSFGMAFIVKDLPKFKEAVAKLPQEEKQKLTEGLRYAKEKLGTVNDNKTRMADLMVSIDEKGNMIYRIENHSYNLNKQTGEVTKSYIITNPCQINEGLKPIVDLTEQRNREAETLYSSVLKESSDIRNTNQELDKALDVFAE